MEIYRVVRGFSKNFWEIINKTKRGLWLYVVTTTYPMINDSTINKSQVRISCGKFTRELDKESLLN